MTAEPNQNIFVVIPAFHEERMIGNVVRQVKAIYPRVIVVDDGSLDATGRVARDHGAVVLTHLLNRGQGAALKTGIDYALAQQADIIVTFDSDGQHHVEDIAALVAPIQQGRAEVVLGSRFLRDNQVPPIRRVTLKLAIWFTCIVSRIKVTDTHNGLRALTHRAAASIRINQDRMAHASEILDEISRLKLRYGEVPTQVTYSEYSRQKGQSSTAAFRIAWDFLLGKWRN